MAQSSGELHEAIEYIKEHGRAIGEAARNGDALARQIVTYYEMLYKCPGDPGARVLLIDAINAHSCGTWRIQPSGA